MSESFFNLAIVLSLNQVTCVFFNAGTNEGKATCHWAAAIKSLEYKSKFSRGVMKIKNPRPLVVLLSCRQSQCDSCTVSSKMHLLLEGFALILWGAGDKNSLSK